MGGNSIWTQYNMEHAIEDNGERKEDANTDDLYFYTFYEETAAGQYVPRNLSVDLEPTVLDDVRRGPMAGMYHPEFLVNGKEDAANNFARGHYTVGKEQMDIVNDRIRKLVDNSENVQGCIVEPYNGLLSTHWLLDHTDVSLVLDNEALYEICQKKLDIKRPSYTNLNNIICKVVSSMTAALRFDGELNVDLNEFQTNLVPFPRLHFMTTSLAPVISKTKTG